MKIIVGIDGGGTKTNAFASDEYGNKIGEYNSGPSNYHNVGIDAACNNLEEAVMKATNGKIPYSACFALAGVDNQNDIEIMKKRLKNLARNVIIMNDAEAVLLGKTNFNPGTLVVAGTGSIVIGYDGKDTHRFGGRGFFFEDVGSAYKIGMESIRHTLHMMSNNRTSLLSRMIISKLKETNQKIAPLTAKKDGSNVELISSLTIEVDNAASKKHDENALFILGRQSSMLANDTIKMAQKISVKSIYAVGSVFSSAYYLKVFKNTLEKFGIGVSFLSKKDAVEAIHSIAMNYDKLQK